MHTMAYVAVLALQVAGALGDSPYNKHMHPVAPSKLTRALPHEYVTVAHLEAPISMEIIGKEPGLYSKIYHTAIEYHVPSANMNATIEFDANSFGPDILLPKTSRGKNGEPIITWNNGAGIVSEQGQVDYNYWLRKKPLGSITGANYNKFLDWLDEKDTQEKFNTYYLFSVNTDKAVDSPTRLHKPLLPSTTCYDFARNELLQLQKQGCQLKEWSGNVYQYNVVQSAGDVTAVKLSDPKVKEDIWNYYHSISALFEKFQALVKDQNRVALFAVMEEAYQDYMTKHDYIYVFNGGEYYRAKLTAPYFQVTYNQ